MSSSLALPPEPPTQLTSPIRVTITPLRSAYHAGEVVSVHFNFTNTRSKALPSAPHLSPSFHASHRRASHSISAAPLSRPPTSPGTPKAASPVTPSFSHESSQNWQRKGVVGVKPKRRSLSVAVNTSGLEQTSTKSSPPTPQILRTASIHPSHPHARKQSVEIPLASASPATASTTSVAAFSASLESITETSDELQSAVSPSPISPRDLSSNLHHPLKKATISGIGNPTHPSVQRQSRSINYSSPGTELLLYCYAQLQGTLILDKEFDVSHLQDKLRRPKVVGGGSMDLSRRPLTQKSFSFLSPDDAKGELDTNKGVRDCKIPTFETQPTPLFIDLSLGPGNCKSYEYAVSLPNTLPPTFKGKFFKIDYHLILGISRAKSPLDGDLRSRYVTQVMKVPLRVYDYVHVSGVRSPYDLLWPTSSQAGRWQTGLVHEYNSDSLANTLTAKMNPSFDTLKGLRTHAASLLQGLAPSQQGLVEPSDSGDAIPGLKSCREVVELLTRTSRKVSYEVLKESLHLATLTFVKPGYRLGESVLGVLDIGRRDVFAGRVLKFCAFLDTEERVPACLSTRSSLHQPTSTRTHSVYHTSLLNATTTVSFQLDIPSDSTPAFTLYDSSSPAAPDGFKWKVRLLLLVALPSNCGEEKTKAGGLTRTLARGGDQSEWGFSYTASESIYPLERVNTAHLKAAPTPVDGSWVSYFTPSFLKTRTEPSYHDGDEEPGTDAEPPGPSMNHTFEEDEDDSDGPSKKWKGKGREGLLEPDGFGEESEWGKMKLERVECEVPIEVWPGNTAFRPAEVVFEM